MLTVAAEGHLKSSWTPQSQALFLQQTSWVGTLPSSPFPSKTSGQLFYNLCSHSWNLQWVSLFRRPSFQNLKLEKIYLLVGMHSVWQQMLTSFHLFSTSRALLQRIAMKHALEADVFGPLQSFPWQWSSLCCNKALNLLMHNDRNTFQYVLQSRDAGSFISVVLSTRVWAEFCGYIFKS